MDMVKSAYNTQELAPLLGITGRAVNMRGIAEGWMSSQRTGRGGGNEWLLESMPAPTRQIIATAIAVRLAAQAPAPSRIDPEVFTVNDLADVPEQQRKRATARALLVKMAREFGAASGTARTMAYELFACEYNRGQVDAPAWVRELLPCVCRASLFAWEAAIGQEGLASLADKRGRHRVGTGVIDATPGMADVVAAHIYEYYNVSADAVMRALRVKFKGQRLPNLRSLQRWMHQYRARNEQTILKIQNPDGWRSKYQSAAGTRPSHRAMEGVFVKWSDPPTLDRMTGHAGEFPNCRCYPEPVVPREDGGVYRPPLPTQGEERNAGEKQLLSVWERVEGSEVIPHVPGAPLVNVDRAVFLPRKLTDYSLDPTHASGGPKSARWEIKLGVTKDHADLVEKQVMTWLKHSPALIGKSDEQGERFNVYVPVTGPNGKTVDVMTAWIYERNKATGRQKSLTPRLINCFIDDKIDERGQYNGPPDRRTGRH
jgi:hypothetical protein